MNNKNIIIDQVRHQVSKHVNNIFRNQTRDRVRNQVDFHLNQYKF